MSCLLHIVTIQSTNLSLKDLKLRILNYSHSRECHMLVYGAGVEGGKGYAEHSSNGSYG